MSNRARIVYILGLLFRFVLVILILFFVLLFVFKSQARTPAYHVA